MSEDLNQTLYQKKLTEIRSLPQASFTDRDNKVEAAKVLQMENYLNYANLINTTKSLLLDNPSINLREIVTSFDSKKGEFSRPEMVDTYLAKLYEETVLTRKALSEFREIAGFKNSSETADPWKWPLEEKEAVGKAIFRSITGKTPSGEVQVISTILGVGVQTENDEDLKSLQKKDKNLGGFYRHRQSVVVDHKQINFPLITVGGGLGSQRIVRHEIQHAVNRAAMAVMQESLSQDVVVARSKVSVKEKSDDEAPEITDFTYGGLYTVVSYDETKNWVLIELPSENGTESKTGWVKKTEVKVIPTEFKQRWGGDPDWKVDTKEVNSGEELQHYLEKQVYPLLIRNAKDELLADYHRKEKFDYSKAITERHGIYDFTDDYIKVLKGGDLLKIPDTEVENIVDQFWQSYSERITGLEEETELLRQQYLDFGLPVRANQLPFVLAQIPLEEWEASNNRDFLGSFSKEMGYYMSVQATLRYMQENYSQDSRYSDTRMKFLNLKSMLRDNPTKSMLPILVECVNELEALKPKE